MAVKPKKVKLSIMDHRYYYTYNPGKTNNKFITSRSFLFSDIVSTSSKKESDELLYTVLVTRYGPQLVTSASG